MKAPSPPLSDIAIRQLRETMELPDAGARFDVRRMIGQGGMGRVYAVFDRVLEREVAMKVLSLDAETPALIQRIAREARVLARLEHPGIAAVYDAGTLVDGRPYYLMRLVRGDSLAQPHTLGSPGERLRVFVRICDAVAFANARGVVHRDIKPGNVMVGEFGDVVVLDWGVAKLLLPDVPVETSAEKPDAVDGLITTHRNATAFPDTFTTADGVTIGTPGFMAPEQAGTTTAPIDERADVYGLGALLHYMLTGHHLRDAHAVATSALPRPLAAIITRATDESPNRRYDTAQELADDVRRWLDAEPVRAYRERPWEIAMRFWQRNRTLLLLLLAYVVVRIAILLWRGV